MRKYNRHQKKIALGVYNAQFLKLVATSVPGYFRLKFLVLDDSQETCECMATKRTLSEAEIKTLFGGKSAAAMAHTQWRIRIEKNSYNDLLTIGGFRLSEFIYPEWFITYHESWQGSANGELNSPQKNAYLADRLKTDPKFSATMKARDTLRKGLRGELSHTEAVYYFGCGCRELQCYIACQFRDDWDWGNQGRVWHLAHITPLAKMDLLDPQVFRMANHFLNLKPESREKNLQDYCN